MNSLGASKETLNSVTFLMRPAVDALLEYRFDDALSAAEANLELDRLNSLCWHDHACALAALGRWECALPSFERACQLSPQEPCFSLSLAQSLFHTHRFTRARACLAQAHRLAAPSEDVAYCLARIAIAEKDALAAEEILRTLVEESGSIRAQRLLATLLISQNREAESRDLWHAVLAADPADHEAKSILAALCWNDGDLSECLRLCEELLAAGRIGPELHSFYLSGLLHDAGRSANEVRRAHQHWFTLHDSGVQPFDSYPNSPDPQRRLRLAYLGGDFYDNPSYYFIFPVFAHHRQDAFEIFVYDLRGRRDWARADFFAHTNRWRDVSSLSEEQIVRQIRRDEIDILIDTTGHYEGHRARVFSAKPAPLQFAYPNYPGTTGQRLSDGIISDPWVCPTGAAEQYSEKPVLLPAGCLPYIPPSQAPAISTLPAMQNGFLTFGLFQRPVKISESCWDAIAAVLLAVPTSRLLIHNSFATLDSPAARIRQNFIRPLAARGIAPERLSFAGPASMTKHLEILASVDIALDSFPYNGQTTTCECLWMGVPVVSLTGAFHVNRVGHMLLSRLGKAEWSAPDAEAYIQTAVSLASDLTELAAIRTRLRPLMAASSIVDGATFTAQFELAMRSAWVDWCARSGSTL